MPTRNGSEARNTGPREEHGLLVARTHSSILRPLPFSALR